MKQITRAKKIFGSSCIGVAMLLAPGHALAEPAWHSINHVNVVAATATVYQSVYILNAHKYSAGLGYRVELRVMHEGAPAPYDDWVSLNKWGTSIASSGSTAYIISLNHLVSKYHQSTGWVTYPNTRCEGGSWTSLRQTTGDNNVAASGSHVYVISGTRTRWWDANNGCWYQMPALPVGSPRDIARSPTHANQIWAVNQYDTIYSWTGSAWVQVTAGTSPGLGGDWVIGSDDVTVWRYSNGSFSYDAKWPAGQGIVQISGHHFYAAVSPTGQLFYYGYGGDHL